MSLDPKNELTYTSLFAAKSQTNNTGSAGVDLRDYVGAVAVLVNVGTPTAGDAADRNFNLYLQSSDTNNISNATNLSVAITAVTNTAALQTLQVDTRAAKRYLFAVPAITGTNSPAYPLGVTLIGTKQVQ